MRILSKTTATTALPSSQDVEDFLRLEAAADLPEAHRLITAARLEVEAYAGVAFFTTQVVALSQPEPGIELRLPVGPLAATPNVVCYDVSEAGVETEITPANIIGGQHPEIILWDEPTWRVKVSYNAGYGTMAGNVPDDLWHATLDQTLRYYETRGADEHPGLVPAAARIAARYRRVAFA